MLRTGYLDNPRPKGIMKQHSGEIPHFGMTGWGRFLTPLRKPQIESKYPGVEYV